MDSELAPSIEALQEHVQDFVSRENIPLENDPRQTPHGPDEGFRRDLVAKTRKAGLLYGHVAPAFGGLGLNHPGKATFFEEAGYSPLGPVALNIAAPDEGNMHLLQETGTAEQNERWLRPLAAGEIRSCFCITEPPPGADSDPRMLTTTDSYDDGAYIINGRKWFTTGAEGAALGIIMAKLDDGRTTMFLTPMNAPGITVERLMGSMDTCFPGGHGVVHFDNLRVPEAAILGQPGEGFEYAQIRLSPARLTYCMRWLGQARRAHDTAVQHARTRHAFGKPIAQHGGLSFMLADNDMDLHIARLGIRHPAAIMDQGRLALAESSRAKVIASEACWRVVDRSVQVLGGQGVTDDTIVARIFTDMRGFRIYHGPSEVHRWSLEKRVLRGSMQYQ